MKSPWSGWFKRDAAAGSATEATAGRVLKPEVIRPEDYVGDDPERNEAVVRKGFVAKAKKYLRHLPLAEETVAMYFCLLDSRTPFWVKATVAAALAYFILPFDVIPDFVPLAGLNDDAGVLAAALATISANLTDEHRAQARAWLAHEHRSGRAPTSAG